MFFPYITLPLGSKFVPSYVLRECLVLDQHNPTDCWHANAQTTDLDACNLQNFGQKMNNNYAIVCGRAISFVGQILEPILMCY
jgi:hypothetical protein